MSGRDRYYITTTIPYVNGKPHIGHAQEFAQTDAFGRYHRLRGDDTYVLTGTDENALKNVQAAEKEGVSTRELVDRNAQRFRELAEGLNLSFDQFIRTSVDPRHKAGAEKIWAAVAASGDIYRKYYSGLYCVGCERYYEASELTDGLCPEHEVAPELIEEENYFFRLSRYGDQLHELIASNQILVLPETRRNEALSFISRGLQDISISRSTERARNWGIPVPGDPSQVIYVWFDALANYLTALDYAADGELYQKYWVDNPHRVHDLGKGVIRFHAIYWPAMLLSAGLALPTVIFVHGYINVAGTKVSKSLGNAIDPEKLVNEYGSEAVRYYLLRAASATADHNFTYEALETRYNADLANDLGNLVNRTLSMLTRYRGGEVPAPGDQAETEKALQETAENIPPQVSQALDDYNPQAALDISWQLVTRANKYVEETAPWQLAKQEHQGDSEAAERLSTVLYTLGESVRLIGVLLEPFLPETAGKILEQLGCAQSEPAGWADALTWGRSEPGTTVAAPEPLFPRRDVVPRTAGEATPR
ncbi:MAG: methionine--tRNA ligase [Chloroflexi bacterium]|nr:MAG: methionine--tRNA ligase [Chloroflexota bacterium]